MAARDTQESSARWREFGLALLIVFLTAIATWLDPSFLSRENLQDIAVRCAPTTIVACGVMLVVITGEIDISVGSLMAILAAIMGVTLSQHHAAWPLWLGIPVVLLAGTAMGAVTGALVTVGRIPSIMVTLGLLTTLRGITTLIMRGENIDGLPESLSRWTKQGPIAGVPLSLWVAAVVVAWTAWLLYRTPSGRRMLAIGSSRQAAEIAGLPAHRLKCFAFAITGFLTAVATVVDVPRLPKIEAGIGAEFELLVVTCVVVGGVSIAEDAQLCGRPFGRTSDDDDPTVTDILGCRRNG